jgi:hypothetical protein
MLAGMPSELQQPESATAARPLRWRSALLPCDSRYAAKSQTKKDKPSKTRGNPRRRRGRNQSKHV